MSRPPAEIGSLRTGALLMVLLFVFGSLGIYLVRGGSFISSFLEASETVLMVDLSDPNPFIVGIKFVLGMFGVILLWVWAWTLIDFMLGGGIERMVKSFGKDDAITRLKKHYIICGAGRTGQVVAETLKEARKSFVFIDKDSQMVESLEDKYPILEGDIADEEILKRSGIDRAAGIFAVSNSDSDNLVTVIVSNEMRPGIPIYARASTKQFIERMKKAGAKVVVSPEMVGGEFLAKAVLGNK